MAMNFCVYCGSKLMEEARFCANCGKPVPQEEASTSEVQQKIELDSKDIEKGQTHEEETSPVFVQEPAMQSVEICGRKVLFHSSIIEYAAFQTQYSNFRASCVAGFETDYKAKVKDFDSLFEEGLMLFGERAASAFQHSVSVLQGYGLNISEQEFYDMLPEENCLTLGVKFYSDIAEFVVETAEKLSSYRALSPVGRSHWQGGGFGISGAIKGALTAGAMNLGLNAVRGIGDAVTTASDRARIKKMTRGIYEETNHAETIATTLENWCRELMGYVERILTSYRLLDTSALATDKALLPIMEAEGQFEKMKSGKVTPDYDKVIDLICEGLPYDPFSPIALGAYLTLYQIPGTNKEKILALTKMFAVDEDYIVKRDEIISDMLAPVLKIPENTAADIDQKISELNKIKKWDKSINITKRLSYLKKKREALNQAEEEAAAKKAEQERLMAENEEQFESLKKLPEDSLEQLQEKCDSLAALLLTPNIEKELKKAQKKLEQAKAKRQEELEEADFLAAFHADLDPQTYAHALVNNVVFRSLYEQLDRNLENTKKLVCGHYETRVTLYQIATKEKSFSHSGVIGKTEVPVMMIFDAGGMYLTNQKVHIRGIPSDSQWTSFPLNEVKSIKIKKDYKYKLCYLQVNDAPQFRAAPSVIRTLGIVNFVQIIEFFINYCLFIAATYSLEEKGVLTSDVLKYARLSMDDFKNSSIDIDENTYIINPVASTPPQSKSSSSSSSGCFITSAVCKSFGKPDNCYELQAFRAFRDGWLSDQPDGQSLIQTYYEIAPRIVERIEKEADSKKIYRLIWDRYLQPCLSAIENGDYVSCKAKYIDMVADLRSEYCTESFIKNLQTGSSYVCRVIELTKEFGVFAEAFDYSLNCNDAPFVCISLRTDEELQRQCNSEPLSRMAQDINSHGMEAFKESQQIKMKKLCEYIAKEYCSNN